MITAEKIKNVYLGKNSNQKMLLAIFQEHNDKVNELVGKDFSDGTAERYKTASLLPDLNIILKRQETVLIIQQLNT